MGSLSYTSDNGPEASHCSYVEARNWQALAREVRDRSTVDSPFDEMVQLYDIRMGPPMVSSFRNVRRIVYRNVDEIAALLCGGTSAIPGPADGLNRDGPIPQPVISSPAITENEPSRDLEDDKNLIEDEDVDTVPPAVNLDDEALAFDKPDAALAQLAQEKLNAAARIFIKTYRARCDKKKWAAKTKLAVAKHLRFVHAYRAAYAGSSDAGRVGSKPWQYRLLLLIPLPYGMTFLEHAHDYLQNAKKRCKKRLTTAEHLELEKVDREITEIK